jgi:hypothetical protein
MRTKTKSSGSFAPPDKRYNGWSNYEPWAVALWIDNEEGTYREWRERTRRAHAAAAAAEPFYPGQTVLERARILLAKELGHWLDEQCPDLRATIWSDLLHSAISEADVFEIAGNWLEEHELAEMSKPGSKAR